MICFGIDFATILAPFRYHFPSFSGTVFFLDEMLDTTLMYVAWNVFLKPKYPNYGMPYFRYPFASKIASWKKHIVDSIWGSFRSFWFHFDTILYRFSCQFENCLLVSRFRRFQNPIPSIWICRYPLSAAVAPRAHHYPPHPAGMASMIELEGISRKSPNPALAG